MARSRGDKVFDWLWLLAWGVASSAWCISAARELGATFDEPVYVARGLEGWRTGSHRGLIRLGTMPLALDLDTLPLYLWEQARGVPFDPVTDLDQLLPWARAGTLVFWWLLLVYGLRAGRQLAGRWGGRLAVALLALEPNLLAHASLATTDLAITACLLALLVHYRAGRNKAWWRRVALPAFWFGAAILAKASAIAFGPLCLLAVELERDGAALPCYYLRALAAWWRRDRHPVTASPRLSQPPCLRALCRDFSLIFAGGMALMFVYCGSDWQPEPSFVRWAHELPNGPGSRAMAWFAEHLCIFSNGGEALVRQIRHNIRGHDGTYLLGQVWPRSAVWYYFPVALTMKLSPLFLLLPLVLLALAPRSLLNWALVAGALLLLFSLNCRVQIGIRLQLPLVALLVVGLAAAAVRVCQAIAAGPGAVFRPLLVRTVLAAGMTWMAISDALVWPNGLCYTNELWGGTTDGYLCLSDSNYDWGQGLKELARWQDRHGLETLDVWYFGTDPALQQLPMHELKLHAEPVMSAQDLRTHAHGHYLAVSTTLLYGMVCDTPEHAHAAFLLRGLKPVDRTTTFLIYDVSEAASQRAAGPQR